MRIDAGFMEKVQGPRSMGTDEERQVSQERTEAIVIKAIDFSESSCIVTLFSPDRGRLTCMAKGVKRPKSQLAGLLDSFNRIEVLYGWKESRSVQQLFDGSLLERYAGIKGDL